MKLSASLCGFQGCFALIRVQISSHQSRGGKREQCIRKEERETSEANLLVYLPLRTHRSRRSLSVFAHITYLGCLSRMHLKPLFK